MAEPEKPEQEKQNPARIQKQVFNVKVQDKFYVELPVKAKIMTIAVEFGKVVIFYLVKEDLPTRTRIFLSVQTGGELSETNLKYLTTLQTSVGTHHIFECPVKKQKDKGDEDGK